MHRRTCAFVAAVTTVASLTGCSGGSPSSPPAQDSGPDAQQSGGVPRNWAGTGVMERISDDRARYQDEGGPVVVFLPANAPSVREVENLMCR